MLKIVQAPEAVLSTKAKEAKEIDRSIKHLLHEMEITLDAARDPEGIGLAAPQIGKSLQIFIVRETPKSPLLTFINPKIEKFINPSAGFHSTSSGQAGQTPTSPKSKKKRKNVQLEGCLSLKDIWGVVKRHEALELSYQDETGKKHTKKFDGFLATIIQHEYDHLNGILFPKRVLEQQNQLYRSVKNSDGETEFEEMTL